MRHLISFFVVLIAFRILTAEPMTGEGILYTGARAPAFEQVDLNGDGTISRDEALSTRVLSSKHFQAADRNHDGRLNKDEYDAALHAFTAGEQRLT